MVTQQLSILDLATEPIEAEQPRCRMCARPARWLTTQQQHAMYCAGKACSNRERICQVCEGPFAMGVDGAGTKYCSTECKAIAYRPRPSTTAIHCAWCGKRNPTTGTGGAYANRLWPYICAGCLDPIKHVVDRLKTHRVPHERARRLLDNPGCEICGTDLLTRTKTPGHGKNQAALVVDHDHECCPGASSCGSCVRGLICHGCNIAAGMIRDDPQRARSLADYLESWFSRLGG